MLYQLWSDVEYGIKILTPRSWRGNMKLDQVFTRQIKDTSNNYITKINFTK